MPILRMRLIELEKLVWVLLFNNLQEPESKFESAFLMTACVLSTSLRFYLRNSKTSGMVPLWEWCTECQGFCWLENTSSFSSVQSTDWEVVIEPWLYMSPFLYHAPHLYHVMRYWGIQNWMQIHTFWDIFKKYQYHGLHLRLT